MRFWRIWSKLLFALFAVGGGGVCSAAYEVGREAETEAFWSSDPVLFVRRHQNEGFKFTSEDRLQADSRRDGGVLWHGLEVYETRITFCEKGGVARLEVLLFNRGGTEKVENLQGADGRCVRRLRRVEKTISEERFHEIVACVQEKLSLPNQKRPSIEKIRLKNTDIRQFTQAWPKTERMTVASLTWNYEQGSKKDADFIPGFIRLVIDGPSRTAKSRARGGAKAARKLSANVVRDARGDVFVDNIPMVDQGTKGYCAAAASERILRYFGTDVDEHEIAMAAGTSAEYGTSTAAMVKTVVALGKRYRFAVRTVAGDAGESDETRIANLEKQMDLYNKTAKRLKKPQIAESVWVVRTGDLIAYRPDAASAAMDPEVLKEMKSGVAGKAKLRSFLREVRRNVDRGQPLLWGVTLGIYPEEDLPQTRGGHMRLIIGYNDKKDEILYSDSWGKGHELKRLPADWAWTITDSLLSVRPL